MRTILDFMSHNSFSHKLRFRMRLIGTFVFFIAAAIFASPGKARIANTPAPMPGLRGEAATEYLKQHGLYSSLMGAAKTEINPQSFSEVKKLNIPESPDGASFGFSVAIYEDTAIVGAYNDDIGNNSNQGSVYVFQRNQDGTNQWGRVKKLIASDGAADDNFGFSVAVYEDTAIVGANFDNVGSNIWQGSAYVFERNQGGPNNWGEVKKLVASDGEAQDRFGGSVAIYEDTVIVGDSADSIGINTLQGSACIFERNQGGTDNWGEVRKLTASDGADGDNFGGSVAIYEDTVIIGAPLDRVGSNIFQGSAYIFKRNQGGAGAWGEVRRLTASDGAEADLFGISVAIYADTAIVGAYVDDVGSNLDQGSAYIFDQNQGGADNWGQITHLIASDGATGDSFGVSVAIYEDTAIVGAFGSVFLSAAPGSARIFERNQGGANNWGEVQKLVSPEAVDFDQFGIDVAISAGTVIVGEPGAAYIYGGGNSPPTISATPVTLDEAAPVNNATVATVSDPDQAADTLEVTVNGSASATINGVTVSNITVNDSGEVSADVVAACGASNADFTLRVTDGNGLFAEATLDVTVTPENVAPVIILKPAISLWPPNHKYQAVTAAQMVESVGDNCSSLSVGDVVIEKVTSDEPDNCHDGGDIVIAADCRSIRLRAERAETSDGRVYTITLRLRDNRGSVTRQDFEVGVPIGWNGVPAVKGATALTVTGNCQ
jgi:hypothetical protein